MLLLALAAALLASFLWARVATWLALIGWAQLCDAHWTERARVAWPVVVDRVFLTVGLPAIGCLCATLAGLDPAEQLGVGAAAFLGAIFGTRDGPRRIFPHVTLTRSVCALLVRTLGLLPLVLAALAALVTPATGLAALAVTLGLAALHQLWTRGFVRILHRTRLAHPAPARVYAAIAALSSTADVAVIASPSPNACAFPLTNEILVGDSLLTTLDDDELQALLAHELGHLAEPRWAKRARAALGWFWLPLPFMPLLVAADLVWLGTSLIALPLMLSTALTRRLEAAADAWAAARVPAAALARALEKVHAVSFTPAIMTPSATHPSLWSRMHAAGVAPSWPRPEPPRRGVGRLSVLVALALTIVLLASIQP